MGTDDEADDEGGATTVTARKRLLIAEVVARLKAMPEKAAELVAGGALWELCPSCGSRLHRGTSWGHEESLPYAWFVCRSAGCGFRRTEFDYAAACGWHTPRRRRSGGG